MPGVFKHDWAALEPRIGTLAAQGLTPRAIGKALGVTLEMMKKRMILMRREGRLPPFQGKHDYSVIGPQMAAMHADGLSYAEIARRFHVEPTSVVWQCRKHGTAACPSKPGKPKPDMTALEARRALGPEPLAANCDYARQILRIAA